MSTRDARAGTTRGRAREDRHRSGTVRAQARRNRLASGRPPAAGGGRQGAGSPQRRGEGLVVGAVPGGARLAGVLLVLAGLAAAAALLPTYLVVGGRELTLGGSLGGTLVALLRPVAHLVVGAVLAGGRVPRFGLAYAAMAGILGIGELLIEVYQGRSSTDRPGVEVLAGERVLTSGVETGPGWVLSVATLALVVLAGAVAVAVWGRTVMDDAGTLDPVRSALAGGAVVLGVATVLCLTLPSADVPDDLVTDPVTGLQTVVPREGPQALLERPGLALLGGLLLAGAVLVCSVVAPSLRPRLAAVGGLLAVAVAVLDAGLGGWRDAAGSADLEWTVPGAGLVLAGLGYVLLTVLAWRLRRETSPRS